MLTRQDSSDIAADMWPQPQPWHPRDAMGCFCTKTWSPIVYEQSHLLHPRTTWRKTCGSMSSWWDPSRHLFCGCWLGKACFSGYFNLSLASRFPLSEPHSVLWAGLLASQYLFFSPWSPRPIHAVHVNDHPEPWLCRGLHGMASEGSPPPLLACHPRGPSSFSSLWLLFPPEKKVCYYLLFLGLKRLLCVYMCTSLCVPVYVVILQYLQWKTNKFL